MGANQGLCELLIVVDRRSLDLMLAKEQRELASIGPETYGQPSHSLSLSTYVHVLRRE